MRENLGFTIFVATAVVVGAVIVLAEDATWAVLAGAVLVHFIATTLVVRAALASADEGGGRAAPSRPRP